MPLTFARRARAAIAWLAIVAPLAPACAARDILPIGAAGQPFQPEADERALWAKAEKEEEALRERVKSYDDPLLDEYLSRLGARLTPDHVRAAGGPGFRFAVLKDPTLNAFALPNGRIYVHTGLLSRLDNEAQLATILGREMTHVIDRHALRVIRHGGNTGLVQNPFDAAVLSQTAGAVLGLGLELAALAAINGYGRDLEGEADAGGMAALERAGYDRKEAPRVFALLQKDSKERGPLEVFVLGRPPRLQERIEATERLLRTGHAVRGAAPDAVENTEEFTRRLRPVVRDNALLDLRAGRFALAQAQLDRVLAITPGDSLAHLYYGDLHRLRSQRARSAADQEEHARLALARYERAAALDPTFADPFRQLGLLYYQQRETARAKTAFRKYLALKPDAPDARRISEYIIELDR